MKTSPIVRVLSLVSPVLLCTSAWAQSPVLEARFNDPFTVEVHNGATLGPDRSGVSGKPKDYCYSADASTYTTGPGPVGTPTLLRTNAIADIQALTVTGWYKVRKELKNDATLFSCLGTQLIWEKSNGQWVWRVFTKKPSSPENIMNWFKSGRTPPLGSWVNPDEWTFIALVWRKADNSAEFYQGGTAVAAALAGKRIVRPEMVEPLTEAANSKRSIGNDANKMERPFDGNLDNFRFFTQALDLPSIEAIRQADTKNEAISLP